MNKKNTSKKLKALSPEKQRYLHNKARKKCDYLFGIFYDLETKNRIEEFKDKFTICEIVYKTILEEHQSQKNGNCSYDNLKIHMNQVNSALPSCNGKS